jgi:murein DD-endopeptidase MepM/ murein hydrolase activator NlpD
MSTPRRLLLAALLATLLLGFAPALAAAALPDTLAQTRAQIAAAREHKASLTEQIATLDGRLAATSGQLARLGDQIDAVGAKLTTTREKLGLLREQLHLKQLELRRAEKKLALEQHYFQQRIVATYKTSDLTYVDVVLESTSFEDLITRVSVVRDFIAGDNDLVGRFQSARDAVEGEKQAIAGKESAVHEAVADLQKQSDALAGLRAAQAAQQAASLALRRQKSGALSSVEGNLALLQRQENELLAESNSLTGVINGSSGGGGGTGSLIWPVNGPVTSPFGWRVNPILGSREFHTGIDIGVGYGTPIHAADSGTVIYATWMGGYGNVIIIDHGRGISTLYAHQSSLAVGNGAKVSRGQTIGYVGSTGFSTGPHLHFEVRLNGNPVDPMAYL